MKTLATLLAFASVVSAAPTVRMGHLHIYSAHPEAQAQFWKDIMGAEYRKKGDLDLYRIPGALIVVNKADAREGSDGSVVNHVGLKVRDLEAMVARCTQAGITIASRNPRQAMLVIPDGIRVELTSDPALGTAVANHHIHFYTRDVNETRNWYDDLFGSTPGVRGPFSAADLPGVNLTFSRSDVALAPTHGRALDHIGFEVPDLEAFTKSLESYGVVFSIPYRKVPKLGIAIAFLTDPWGATVELTEGLDSL